MAIFRSGSPNGGIECRWGRQKFQLSTNIWLSDARLAEWMTSGVRITNVTVHIQPAIYHTDCHASMNRVYHNQHVRPRRRENRTEQNLFVRSGKSEAKAACARRMVLLKLSTDRDEASRDLYDSMATCLTPLFPVFPLHHQVPFSCFHHPDPQERI